MTRRRPFGHVFRRYDKVPDGKGGFTRVERPGWYVRIRTGGRSIVRFGGSDRDTAIEFVHRLARASERKELLGEQPPCEVVFEVFAERYIAHCKQVMTESTWVSRYRLVRGILIPRFRGRRLDQITTVDIRLFLDSRTDVTGTTLNRYLTVLSGIFRRAMELGLIARSPTRDVRRAKEVRTALTIVPDDRVVEMIDRMEEPVRTFYVMLVESGLRLSEALRLEWGDVDFEHGTLTVRMSKAKRPRIVALTSRLRAALLEHHQRRMPSLIHPLRVFPLAMDEAKRLRYAWRRQFEVAATAIGFPKLRIHDLRHLHAIALVRRGIDLPTVQNVLGHSSLLSTLRYAEYADDSAPFRAARALDASRQNEAPGQPGRG